MTYEKIDAPARTGYLAGADGTEINIADQIKAIRTKVDEGLNVEGGGSGDTYVDATSVENVILTGEVLVDVTPTLIAAGASTLSGRIMLRVYNLSDYIVYLGTSAVTVDDGLPLLPHDMYPMPVAANIYGVAATSGVAVRVMESQYDVP